MRPLFFSAFMCFAVLFASGCGSYNNPTTDSPTLTSVSVSYGGLGLNSDGMLLVGNTTPFTATAHFSAGAGQNVTSLSTWGSANTSVATVSPSGLVTAVGIGSTSIAATYQGQTGTVGVITAP